MAAAIHKTSHAQMNIAGQLSSFDPDPDALIRRLAPRVTDRMLARIAALDYGRDAERHAAALKQMRDDQKFPEGSQWYPDEVLLLALGGGLPDYTGSSTELSAAEQDVCMGFVAVCLLRRLGDPKNERHAGWLLRG